MAKRQPEQKEQKGLTFGRLLIVLLAAILLAFIAAFFSSLSTPNQLSFEEIGFDLLKVAGYDKSELSRAQLKEIDKATAKISGALIFVKTNAGRYAKLVADFNYRFYATPLEFVIFRGEVYNPDGSLYRKLGIVYVPLNLSYDLDAGRTSTEGANESEIDLKFLERGTADQLVLAVNGATFAVPASEALKRK